MDNYKVINNREVEIAANNEEKYIRELLDSSYQGIKRLFVLAYDDTAGNNRVSTDSFKKYIFPRVKIATSKLMKETFMINQLMTRLNSTAKLE